MSDGDFKPYKKGFGWKRFNRLLKLQRKYRVIPNRPGWEQTPDGIMPPPTPGGGIGGDAPAKWNIIPGDSDDFTVNVGHIAQWGYCASEVTISNKTASFSPAADDVLSLKFTAVSPTTCELSLNSEGWTDYPTSYSFDVSDNFDEYHYPLWYFTSTEPGTKIADGVYGVRVVGDTDFAVINGIWEVGTGAEVVPALVEYHAKLPEFSP